MRNGFALPGGLCVLLFGAGWAAAQTPQWTAVWHGVDRPGPENLLYTTGWPVDPPGFEQYDPGNCYSGNGPRYAEGINVNTAGFLTIQNLLDGTCLGIGPVNGLAPCNFNDPNPCGMRYQAGPRTERFNGQGENAELLHHQSSFGFGNPEPRGMTFEISFNIQQLPTNGPVELMKIQAYVTNAPVGAGGAVFCTVTLRKNLAGILGITNNNEWHVVLEDGTASRTWNIGNAHEMIGQWVTTRVIIGIWGGKLSKFAWRDGFPVARTPSGTDCSQTGSGVGIDAHARFGPNIADGDVRIGTMAYSNQGMFVPVPTAWCLEHHNFVKLRLDYLAPAARSIANPENCNNGVDDNGDGRVDCDDPQCFQSGVCGNLLVNGSFETGSTLFDNCSVTATTNGVPASDPLGWTEQGTSGQLVANGTIWLPVNQPLWTDGQARGGLSSGGGALSAAYQQVSVPPGEIRLRGDIAGAGGGTMFVEIRDGNVNGPVIDQFTFSGTEFNTDWRPFELSGNSSGSVTVRWGFDGGAGTIRGVHVDNLYLAPGVSLDCNDPFADADGDGDVDVDDFGVFQRCMTGPGDPTGAYDFLTCGCFDVEPDFDVDLSDFQVFQDCTSGPAVPANSGCDD